MDCCENTGHKIKIPTDPEGRGIFNPTTGNDDRGRASGYQTKLKEMKKEVSEETMKGGKHMVGISKRLLLWAVIGVLLLATLFLTFKSASLSAGTVPATVAAAKTAASTLSTGMVGGC